MPVTGLVPDEIFFDHLANRRFPAGAFIRPEAQMDYLEEPDIFHDVFGHVPLLANPVYADFMQAYGKGGQRALGSAAEEPGAALLVHGRVRTDPQGGGLRIFGAGIMSSMTESVFALDRRLAAPHRVRSRTRHAHQLHHRRFPAELFRHRQFRESCWTTAIGISARSIRGSGARPTSSPIELIEGDKIVTHGTLAYFKDKADKA